LDFSLLSLMVSQTLELAAHDFTTEDVGIVVLEIFEDGLDSSNLVVKELLTVLVMPHSNIVSHVVVLHQVIHFTILLCGLVNTGVSILPLRCGK